MGSHQKIWKGSRIHPTWCKVIWNESTGKFMSLWLWVWVCIMSYVLWVYICVIYNQGWVKRHDMYTWYVFSEFCLNIVKKKILNINTKYRWKHQSILSFLFTLHNSNLLLCLHLLTSSDLFFIKLQSLTEIWWNFSVNFFGNSPFNYWCYMLILQTSNIFWKFGTLQVHSKVQAR